MKHLFVPMPMKLYALRSRDYFRSMSEEDRRDLLFNPIQKMKVTTQGGDVNPPSDGCGLLCERI